MKNALLLYYSYMEQFELLTDDELGRLIRAVMKYDANGKDPELDGMLQMAFSFIKTDLDANRKKYETRCQKNRDNGQRGGRPKKQLDKTETEKSERLSEKPKKPDTDIEMDMDIDNDNDKKKKTKKKTEYDILIESYSDDSNLTDTLYEFVKMRKTVKSPLTSHALELILKKLDKLAADNTSKIEILNNSITNNWKGVYPIKSEPSHSKSPPKTRFNNFEQNDCDISQLEQAALKKRMEAG